MLDHGEHAAVEKFQSPFVVADRYQFVHNVLADLDGGSDRVSHEKKLVGVHSREHARLAHAVKDYGLEHERVRQALEVAQDVLVVHPQARGNGQLICPEHILKTKAEYVVVFRNEIRRCLLGFLVLTGAINGHGQVVPEYPERRGVAVTARDRSRECGTSGGCVLHATRPQNLLDEQRAELLGIIASGICEQPFQLRQAGTRGGVVLGLEVPVEQCVLGPEPFLCRQSG